jgi:hypothetical protein
MWTMKGVFVQVDDVPSFSVMMSETDYGKFMTAKDAIASSAAILDPVFAENGFTKNKENTFPQDALEVGGSAIDAYEKGSTKCLVAFIASYDAVSCSDKVAENYPAQASLKKDLGLDSGSEQDNDITLENNIGNFYHFELGEMRGTGPGHYLIAEKLSDGHYKKLQEGNGSIDCSVMRTYHVPKDLYPGITDAACIEGQ